MVEVKGIAWEMKNGVIIAVKIDNAIFYCNGNKNPRPLGGRTPAINEWIQKNRKIGGSFNLDEFYRDHPTCKQKPDGTENELSRLCRVGVLLQTSNNSFKVLKYESNP